MDRRNKVRMHQYLGDVAQRSCSANNGQPSFVAGTKKGPDIAPGPFLMRKRSVEQNYTLLLGWSGG